MNVFELINYKNQIWLQHVKLKFENIIEAYLRINFHFAGYTE